MEIIKIFFRHTVLNFFLFMLHLLAAPFSRLSRHKLSGAYQKLTYPFYGERYKELSSLLKNENLLLTIAPVKAKEHNVSEFELLTICALLKDRNSNKVFEIGTYDGRSTRAMALNLKDEHGRVYTLNLPPETSEVNLITSTVDVQLASKVTSGERFLETEQSKFIVQLWGDSAKFDFSSYYGSMDMVFIDGAHSKHYVKNDTEIAVKLISPEGGIIVWHDAHLYGVVDFLKEWIKVNSIPVYFVKHTTIAVAFLKEGKFHEHS